MTNIIQLDNRWCIIDRYKLMLMICLISSISVFGQRTTLSITAPQDQEPVSISRYPLTIDSIRVPNHMDSLISIWKQEGYLNAQLDTIIYSGKSSNATIYRGYRYDQLSLDIDNKTLNLLQEAGLDRVKWIKGTYDHSLVSDAMDKILIYLENNGYPFATVQMDSVIIDKGIISSSLLVDKKELVLYDTLDIKGDANLSDAFIKRYLDIIPGKPYNLKQILDIKRKISSLPYCQLKADPIISFVNGKAILRLQLAKKQASTFDFIIGVLPSNENGSRAFNITGEFTGDLHNELGYGERIYAKFERLRPETQELELKFNMPYLANLPFGIDTDFGLYRNSTNFLDLKSKVGLQYLFSGLDFIDASWYFNSSRLIEIDTAALQTSKKLPSQLDVNYTGGGVGISVQRVDYRFNPGRGWRGALTSTVGVKSIVPNATIRDITIGEIDFDNAYDTLSLSTFQTELSGHIEYYKPIGQWATIKTSLQSAFKYNQDQLYDNELFRIGGNRLLRGFDEQSILTDLYAVLTAEFRVILDQNSFLSFPFIDYGRVHSLTDDELAWENTVGAGIGLNFATGAGIFNVSFAVGKRDNIPIDLSATKIHFGYVSLF